MVLAVPGPAALDASRAALAAVDDGDAGPVLTGMCGGAIGSQSPMAGGVAVANRRRRGSSKQEAPAANASTMAEVSGSRVPTAWGSPCDSPASTPSPSPPRSPAVMTSVASPPPTPPGVRTPPVPSRFSGGAATMERWASSPQLLQHQKLAPVGPYKPAAVPQPPMDGQTSSSSLPPQKDKALGLRSSRSGDLPRSNSGKEKDSAATTSSPTPSRSSTPKVLEVSVEGQEAVVPHGAWTSDGCVEALAGEAACTITVKAGLAGRSNMQVVLRVGLEVGRPAPGIEALPEASGSSAELAAALSAGAGRGNSTPRGLRLRFAREAFGDWAAVHVSGSEECDIGRLSSRSSQNTMYPSASSTAAVPLPGACVHSWSEDAATSCATSDEDSGVKWLEAAQAISMAPRPAAASQIGVRFDKALDVKVAATCRIGDTGQATLKLQVDGELRLRPRFCSLVGSSSSSSSSSRAAIGQLYGRARRHFLKGGGEDREAKLALQEALVLGEGLQAGPLDELGDILNLLGAVHLRQRSPQLAVQCLERALHLRTAQDAATASTLSTLGNAQQMLGAHADALRSFQRSAALLEVCSEKEAAASNDQPGSKPSGGAPLSAALGSALHSLGGAYRALGRHADARESYTKALAVRERALGPSHALNAATLNNLGAVLQQLADHRGALRAYQQALAIQVQKYGPDHCVTAATLSNLGSAHEKAGEYNCAVNCHCRALAVQEKWLGSEHPGVAATLHNLGNSLAAWGRGRPAAVCHWRALAIWSTTLGPAHPDIAATLHSLGNVYRGLSQPQAAAQCFAGALRIREVALGPEHPDTARTRHCAALAGCDLGARAAALDDLQAAASSLLSTLGAQHPWCLQARADLEALKDAD
eukprot:TRINITY_DN13930_c0_g1_i1.p1 TRINITY_DN13930_c0_g1~~TRINITY_DN13930_c0_g1_i1.p1  ORF type:complete len:875 (-),score=201.80 TRINITY_DN13930_c0_g1_i1:199-2823(-)